MERHNAAVKAIASEVERFHQLQRPFRIYHGSTNSTRQSQHGPDNTISTADLTHVLDINTTTRTALVEPNVPMDALAQATAAHHLVPLVVMEFPGITVGGGFSGTSGESSSFRHGFFDATVNWIEFILPNGEITRASKTDRTDLFWGAASAFGTLGVVTMLEVQLRPAKPFIELRYYSTSSMDEAMHVFRAVTNDPSTEYLDGIVYARDHVVVCAGKLVDVPRTAPVRLTRPWDEWYYLRAQNRSHQSSGPALNQAAVDYIPLADYLFRYDRGAFWVGRYAYSYFFVPFIYLTRVLLDWFMHTRVMYHALHESGHAKRYIIQDVAVPYAGTSEFVNWLDNKENFGAYPIWLCPLRHGPGMMERSVSAAEKSTEFQFEKKPNATTDDYYLMNFGLWAPSRHPSDRSAFLTQNRRLERKVLDLQGKKWLYAHAYYTEDEFWSIYDKKQYDALREKYHASYLPDLYQKVRVDLSPQQGSQNWVDWAKSVIWEIRPVSGLYGVYKALRGGEYFIRKSKTA